MSGQHDRDAQSHRGGEVRRPSCTGPATDSVLQRLQRLAGNRAVSAAVRDGRSQGPTVQRAVPPPGGYSRAGWQVLLDGSGSPPDIILPRYGAGQGRRFVASYSGGFDVYRDLRLATAGANNVPLGDELLTKWATREMGPGHLPNPGETVVRGLKRFYIEDNQYSETSPFQVRREARVSGPDTVTRQPGLRDLSQARTVVHTGGGSINFTRQFQNAVAVSEAQANGFTRTLTFGQAQGVEGQVAAGNPTEGVAGQLKANMSWSESEAQALARTVTLTSGVTTTDSTAYAAQVTVPEGRPVTAVMVPIVELATYSYQYLDAGADGVVASRTPRTGYFHVKLVTGMIAYTGRTQAEAEQKAQADDRTPAYPIPGETYPTDPALGTAPPPGPPEPNSPGTQPGPAPGQQPPG